MSCLTAPPLVSLLSLSRVQSQINSRLFLTLTYPSTRLHLQLAPLLCRPPAPRSPPPHRCSRWRQPRKWGRGPRGLPRAAAAAPDVAPLCAGDAREGWAPAAGKGGPVSPSHRPGGCGTAPASRHCPTNLGWQLPVTTKNLTKIHNNKTKFPEERKKQAKREHNPQEENKLFTSSEGAIVPSFKLGRERSLMHKISCVKVIIFSVFIVN